MEDQVLGLRSCRATYPHRMKPRVTVRELSAAGRQALELGIKSADGFIVRRSQITLASPAWGRPVGLGRAVGLTSQVVRDASRAL